MRPRWTFMSSLVLLSVAVQVYAVTMSDLFNLDSSCSAVSDTIEKQREDAANLANAAINAFKAYGQDKVIQREIDAAFVNPSSDQRATILSNYEKVNTFLTTAQDAGSKATLFCSKAFAEKKDWSDQARKNDKTLLTFPNGNPASIEAFYTAIKGQPWITQVKARGYVPYWVDLKGIYIFTGPDGLENAAARGLTYDIPPLKFVLLLPAALGSNFLGSVQPKAIAAPGDAFKDLRAGTADPSLDLQNINDIRPSSATLFHELFHLVVQVKLSLSSNPKEVYPYDSLTKLTSAQGVENAESYTLCAVAIWNSQNRKFEESKVVDWSSGFAITAESYP